MRPARLECRSVQALSVSPASCFGLRVQRANTADMMLEDVIENGETSSLKPGHLFFPCLYVLVTTPALCPMCDYRGFTFSKAQSSQRLRVTASTGMSD